MSSRLTQVTPVTCTCLSSSVVSTHQPVITTYSQPIDRESFRGAYKLHLTRMWSFLSSTTLKWLNYSNEKGYSALCIQGSRQCNTSKICICAVCMDDQFQWHLRRFDSRWWFKNVHAQCTCACNKQHSPPYTHMYNIQSTTWVLLYMYFT